MISPFGLFQKRKGYFVKKCAQWLVTRGGDTHGGDLSPVCQSDPLYFVQSIDCGSALGVSCPGCFCILSLFCRLHVKCASCKFSMALGCPPRSIGMIWSTVGDSGCGNFNDLSTGLPQIPQISCVIKIFFRFRSNACLCVPSRSGLAFVVAIIKHLPKLGGDFSIGSISLIP